MLGIASLGLLLAAAALPSARATAALRQATADAPDFERDVLPILTGRCFECHGPDLDEVEGGLRLDSHESLLEGGDSGPAYVPEDPTGSLFVVGLQWTDDLFSMPPEEPLPDAERLVLERWIAAGAPWPAGLTDSATDSGPTFSPADLAWFEQEVRPLLAGNCFVCHGPDVDRAKSGLRMVSREAFLRGGDRGPAVVPGDPEQSLLVRAVRYASNDLAMPPTGALPAESVAVLEEWVRRGVIWPATPASSAHDDERAHLDVESARTRWPFAPLGHPEVPELQSAELADRARNPIDAFVFARLEAEGLAPSPPATTDERVRRLWFDLLGLPPALADLEAFRASEAELGEERAWSALVDELLERPQYGERWARHWLDVVRFAQTNGYERDEEKPYAWRYRDWVVDALNADLPYDAFLRAQLAGDELDLVTPESLVATGFYRLGTWDKEPDDAAEARMEELDDIVRVISEGTLGLSLGCARCHDHKFDPLFQEDYYSMVAFVRGLAPYEDPRFEADSPTHVPLVASGEDLERWRADRDASVAAAQAEMDALVEGARARLTAESPGRKVRDRDVIRALPKNDRFRLRVLTVELESARESFEGDLPWALAARDVGAEAPPTHLLVRGRAASPGPEVEAVFPRALVPDDAQVQPVIAPQLGDPEDANARPPSTGRRRALADWIASEANPLTARVIANRLWHHHFGRGIVATPNDFGAAGIPPTHPELLDWLARDLVDSDWSLKALHRRILTSATWNQTSHPAVPAATDAPAGDPRLVDPDNSLLWRQHLRRLEAEALRDSLAVVAGTLDLEARGGRGFFPGVPRGALAGMSRPGEGWSHSTDVERERRSLYAFEKRGLAVPFLEVFDRPPPNLPIGARNTTTVAPQALTLLNGAFATEQARALARRVREEVGEDPAEQIERVVELALSRHATPAELEILLEARAQELELLARARPEVRFGPAVPERLAVRYLGGLPGDALVDAPQADWTTTTGLWGGNYNGTLAVEPLAGPASQFEGAGLPRDGDARAAGELFAADGTTHLGLFLDARAHERESTWRLDGETAESVLSGLELVLLPAAAEVLAVEHDENGRVSELARASLAPETFETGRWVAFALARENGRVTLRLDETVALDVAVPASSTSTAGEGASAGHFAIAVRGGQVALRDTRLESPAGTTALPNGEPGTPADRALAALCLLVFNLNEFAYVD